jgi:hypothetical protein
MHMMNPQRAAHMAPTPGPAANYNPDAGGPGPGADPHSDPNAGIGSALAGYAGSEDGPFECGNCVHFDGQSKCDNPQVISDPEVNGQVEAEGCCNLFSPAQHEGDEDGSGADDEGETGAIPGAGEGGQ